MTLFWMCLLVVALLASIICGARSDQNKDSFMSIDDTTFLRGFWCIVVVLVHVPAIYQNQIQDMIGSFAYIGVTFFFMTSAYGLKQSLAHKVEYMATFWKRRLPPILVPAVIANAIQVGAYALNGADVYLWLFADINDWVKVLLLYYFCFWVIYGIFPKLINPGVWQDAVMCLIVFLCSLIDYFTELKITLIWIVEPLGFAYGIIAARYSEQFKKWIGARNFVKAITLLIVSLFLGLAYLNFKSVPFWGDYILKICLGIFITAFIFTFIGKIKIGNKVNTFLSDVSYEVYLLHRAVFALVMAVGYVGINSGLYVLVAVCVTVVMSYGLKALCRPVIQKFVKVGG